jgi:hypothetical protein
MEVPVAAHRGVLPMLQWVPADAVRPTTTDSNDQQGRRSSSPEAL